MKNRFRDNISVLKKYMQIEILYFLKMYFY